MSRCGGPLVVQTNQGGYLQVGIGGGGVQCGDPTMPGTLVYRLDQHHDEE
jgi:secreted trypsin-like serine protease